MAKTRVFLKIDVDTYRGTREGVPAMLDDLEAAGVRASFFFTLGPDNSGRAILRVFTKPGFLGKMLRTNAAKMYGVRTALYGTLLPAPIIGRRCAATIARCRAAGHEVGLHAWDHIAWQDRLHRLRPSAVGAQIDRGIAAFAAIFGERPRGFAAPAWFATDDALEALDARGFDYLSISRTVDNGAAAPFRPRVRGRALATVELPTTLPTLDEDLGRDGVTAETYVERLVARYRPGADEVLTVHAETEGLAYRSLFQRLLARHRELGIATLPLADLARETARGPAPLRDVGLGTVPGRSGRVLLALGAALVLAITLAAGALSAAQPPPAAGPPAIPPASPSVAPAAPPAVGVPPSAVLSLDQAIALALAANRSLAAARLGRDIATANVAVARERPNPDLSFEEDRETPHDLLTLSQPIESTGKRRRRIVLAQAQAASGEADLAKTAADLRNQVRRAYFGLAAAERRATLGNLLLEIAGRTLAVARQRFDAGDAPRLEVLQAELASAQADNEARGVRSLLAAGRADLNTLLGRPPEVPVGTGGEAAGELKGNLAGDLGGGAVPPAAEATRQALAASAELAALDRKIVEERARLDLARAQRYPDPAIAGTVTHRSQPDYDWGWHAGVTVNLPLFTRHQAAVEVEERTLAQLAAQRAARAEEIGGEIYSAAVQAETAREQALRFRDEILPRAEQVEALAEDSYRSGQTGLAALLQAFQATRDLRLQAIQSGLDYQNALADLEKAMGVALRGEATGEPRGEPR